MSKIEENTVDQNDSNLLKIRVLRMPLFAGNDSEKRYLASCIECQSDFITNIISLKGEMKATTRNRNVIKFFKYWDFNKKYLKSTVDSKLICEFPNAKSRYILDLCETVFHNEDANDPERGELLLTFNAIEIGNNDKIEQFKIIDQYQSRIKVLKVPEFLQKDDGTKSYFIKSIEDPYIFKIKAVDIVEGDLITTTKDNILMRLFESWNLVTQIPELQLDSSLYCEFIIEQEKYRLELKNYIVGNDDSDSYDSKVKEMSMIFNIIKIDGVPEDIIEDVMKETDTSINNNKYKIGNTYYNETSRLQFDTRDELNNFVKEHNIENYRIVYGKASDQFSLYSLVERNEELEIGNIELPKFIKTYLSTSELIETVGLIKKYLKLYISSTAKAIVGYTNNKELKKFFKLWYNGVYPNDDHFYYGQTDEILNKTYMNEIARITINHDCYNIYNVLISKRMQTLEEDNDTLEIYFDITSTYVDEKGGK